MLLDCLFSISKPANLKKEGRGHFSRKINCFLNRILNCYKQPNQKRKCLKVNNLQFRIDKSEILG